MEIIEGDTAGAALWEELGGEPAATLFLLIAGQVRLLGPERFYALMGAALQFGLRTCDQSSPDAFKRGWSACSGYLDTCEAEKKQTQRHAEAS